MVLRTERGWGGHFCCADKCLFRRNTLLVYHKVGIVVSTVGNLMINGKYEDVGVERQYETMVFFADMNSPYRDIDVEKQICTDSKWYLTPKECTVSDYPDLDANEMHEKIVSEITYKLYNGDFE